MKSTIKIIKRDQRNAPKQEEPEIKQTPEQSAREMVIVAKRWVTEWKERKATLMYLTFSLKSPPLKTRGFRV